MFSNKGSNVGGDLRPGDIVRVVGGTLTFVERIVEQHDDRKTVWFVFESNGVTVNIPAHKLARHFGGPNGGVK
jgi:hypothetical protein